MGDLQNYKGNVMSRPKITKATRSEKIKYSQRRPKPVHPLYGVVNVSGTDCVIEFLNEGSDNPNYEVIAPAGKYFPEHDLHNVLCGTVADILDQMTGVTLEPCPDGSSCSVCGQRPHPIH